MTSVQAPAVTPIESRGYAKPEVLVSTDWVAQHLDDPKVRLVESNEDILLYDTGHIPGAVKVDWTTDLNDQVVRDYVDRDRLQRLLRSKGINNDTTIVFYGDKNNWWATYALWVLSSSGSRTCSIMDGGRLRWVDEGRPLSTDKPGYPEGNITVDERDDSRIRAFRDDVLDHLKTKGQLVDVRSPEEYSGQKTHMPEYPQEGCLRGGHIPGAKSVPWAKAIDPETHTFSPASRAQEALRAGQQPEEGRRRRSPTAGSASAPRTPGSRSPTCWASTTCGTTTGRGPSGGTRCGCRWSGSSL